MPKLLYIEASPRKSRSKSIEVAQVFLSELQKRQPSLQTDKLDLWATELPPFNGHTLESKYAIINGQAFTPEQATAWRAVEAVADRFKAADWYLFSLPMWNFGLPYVLKHYIDLLVQPGLTFTFKPDEGYKGLVTGNKAAMVFARGGAYSPGTGAEEYDLQSKALSGILGFIGITDQTSIFVEPTIGAPADVDAIVAKAKETATAAAKAW
jgi:FMN-dependent NADH-azoreductase